MDPGTSVKETITIKLTPTSKQFMCILCGEMKQNRKDRQKLQHDGTENDLYCLIEKLMGINITVEGHSGMCCRNCALRLKTIDKSLQKFKETYDAVRKRLEVSHGHKSVKRMPTEHRDSSKRKALFAPGEHEEELDNLEGVSGCSFDTPLQVSRTESSYIMSNVIRKSVLCHMRTTKTQIRLRIRLFG